MSYLGPEEYLDKKVRAIIEPMLTQAAIEQPKEPILFMIEWLQNLQGKSSLGKNMEKEELQNLRREINRFKKQFKEVDEEMQPHSPQESENDDEEADKVDELIEKRSQQLKVKPQRSSVSAEVYGVFNKKADFKAKVIAKTNEQRQRIINKVTHSFLFDSLEDKDLNTVIDAMEERKYNKGDNVITQGENGDVLYLVEQGTLDCFKTFTPGASETFLKTYNPGEAFGELALLYNAPRAATVRAKNECILWALDRETFNHIVKDAAMKKREKYENILKNVEILHTVEPYEISQIADAVKVANYIKNETIIKQNEDGDTFYIVLEGEAYATKVLQEGGNAEIVKEYTKGMYFGELALIRNEPRAANIIAKTDCKLLSLDRLSFKRLLGPIENLLKRNSDAYVKFIGK